MERIKYRQWQPAYRVKDTYVEAEFHYWGYILPDHPTSFVMPISSEHCKPSQQFTGLVDRNGVEIFVGDIVLAPYGKYKYNANEDCDESKVQDLIKSEVRWQKTGLFAKCLLTHKAYRIRVGKRRYMFDTHHNECEVIGNIYDNPELLHES